VNVVAALAADERAVVVAIVLARLFVPLFPTDTAPLTIAVLRVPDHAADLALRRL
jgi:hypothetical protein